MRCFQPQMLCDLPAWLIIPRRYPKMVLFWSLKLVKIIIFCKFKIIFAANMSRTVRFPGRFKPVALAAGGMGPASWKMLELGQNQGILVDTNLYVMWWHSYDIVNVILYIIYLQLTSINVFRCRCFLKLAGMFLDDEIVDVLNHWLVSQEDCGDAGWLGFVEQKIVLFLAASTTSTQSRLLGTVMLPNGEEDEDFKDIEAFIAWNDMTRQATFADDKHLQLRLACPTTWRPWFLGIRWRCTSRTPKPDGSACHVVYSTA